MAKEFPKIDKKNKGKFTRWVKRNMKGSSTCDAADKVMAAKKASILTMLEKWLIMLKTLVAQLKNNYGKSKRNYKSPIS